MVTKNAVFMRSVAFRKRLSDYNVKEADIERVMGHEYRIDCT